MVGNIILIHKYTTVLGFMFNIVSDQWFKLMYLGKFSYLAKRNFILFQKFPEIREGPRKILW